MSKKTVLILTVITALSVIVLSAGCKGKTARVPKPEPKKEEVVEESPKKDEAQPAKPQTGNIAVIQTEKGIIKFKFYPNDAPKTVDNFIKLTKSGFYNGTKFHRVVPGFVIQGGDPLSKTDDPRVGTGGPGYNIPAEFNNQLHLEGTVAMARSSDPNSAGSQFYICLAPQPSLDGQYTVFGQVIEGMDAVHKIVQGNVMVKISIE